MSSPYLHPCPICGSEVHISASSDGYGIECTSHGCLMLAFDEFPTPELAAQYWNTRSERYILLPVDADGVPIRVGDELVLQYDVKEKPSEVESITFDGEDWYFTSSDGFFNAVGWHHAKPRTLEDVLAEYRLEADRLFCDPSIGGEDRADALESLDAKYAAEIRELMEEGE